MGVKYPHDMAEQKSFLRAMRVAVRITELVVEPMYANPIQWITLEIFNILSLGFDLKSKNSSVSKGYSSHFGSLKLPWDKFLWYENVMSRLVTAARIRPNHMSENRALQRAHVLANHILQSPPQPSNISLTREVCLQYTPPELNESYGFQVKEMRKLLDGHNLEDRDWLYGIMVQSNLFNRKERGGGKVFVSPDYNETMKQQREISMKRILYLLEKGVFKGWLTETSPEAELKKFALYEVCGMYDYSLSAKLGVHFLLWGNAVKFFGTKRHHEKWLKNTEDYLVKGCFAMTELGHGSNVRGIETVTTYDTRTEEFVINTPCESAQKYWIGEAAIHATHAIVISQLEINGTNQGIHVFVAQVRDQDGNICPNIRIADCGHKIGVNGVDIGRIWFDNFRIPRENLLNSVADVSSDGQYVSTIKNPDQRFGAFLAPLTCGRVTIAATAIYSAKIGLAVAIRYSLSRRAFSDVANGPEVLLLDYPSHQRRLLPLLAKT
ncbi:hypothetical protein Bca101_044522 [Brassica carinata]